MFRTGADLQIKAQDVYFGNLIKHDSFLTHYIVDNDPKNGWYGNAEMMKHYFADNLRVRKSLFLFQILNQFLRIGMKSTQFMWILSTTVVNCLLCFQ